MRRIERRADRHHRARVGDAVRGGEHRGAAEAVTDQDRRRGEFLAQMIGGSDQVVDIRRKRRIGELAFAGAKPGEIEAQHGDAVQFKAVGDMTRRPDALAAGEAMREQRDRAHRTLGTVEQRGELLALIVGKIELFGRHDDYLPNSRIAASNPSMVSGYIREPITCRIKRIEAVVSHSRSGTGLSQTHDG